MCHHRLKFVLILLALSGLITGCETSKKTANKRVQPSATMQKATRQTRLWTPKKEKALAKFMAHWSAQMHQQYVDTYDGKKPNHLGFVFPDAITKGQLKGRSNWGEQPIALTWSTTGEEAATYKVVAVATEQVEAGYPITYLFVIHQHHPVVFLTKTTNGDTVYFYDTQNQALQEGFAKLVLGANYHQPKTPDLNRSLSEKATTLPATYRRTWYYYDYNTDHYEKNDLSQLSALRLSLNSWHHQELVNVHGRDQTAGAGDTLYLRYHYFDGRPLPVLMSAHGAGMWFDANQYTTMVQAKILKAYKFGDETPEQSDDF